MCDKCHGAPKSNLLLQKLVLHRILFSFMAKFSEGFSKRAVPSSLPTDVYYVLFSLLSTQVS